MVDNLAMFYPNDSDHEPGDLREIKTQDLLTFALNDYESMVDLNSQPRAFQPAIMEPEHWSKFPNLVDIDSEYQFDIHVDRGENINWLYQPKVGKIYIKLNSVMNLSFSYVGIANGPALFLRAMILFSSPDEMHLPVKRCPNHRIQRDPSHVPVGNEVPDFHILKCCHPNVQYCGEEVQQIFGKRSSLLVPLCQTNVDEAGRCTESIGLEFLCQNSCANGIQRKQTVLVFTLENERYEILGKKLMHFKVCSCPKRDMVKEMQGMQHSKKRESNAAPTGKHPSKMVCINTRPIKTEPPTTPQTPPVVDMIPQQSPSVNSTVPIADRGVALSFMMPNISSAQYILRCAYNECTGLMARDKDNIEKYIMYARNIERLQEVYSEQSALQ